MAEANEVKLTDIELLVQEAITFLRSGISTMTTHFKEHETKCTCSVNVDISVNREGDVVVNLTPKLNLPQNSSQFIGEFTQSGEFRIM